MPIFGCFWILTPNKIFYLFVLLETSLEFEKVINLPYWKPTLNIRIFVYNKNKTKTFLAKFLICVMGTQGLILWGP